MAKGRYRGEVPDLLDRIKELEDRISKLERTPQAGNTAVNTGGITIKGGSLDVIRKPPQIRDIDTWSRVETNGWGKNDVGIQYAIVDGPASAFSADKSYGYITVPTVNTTHRALLQSIFIRDFDLTVEYLVAVTPTGGYIGQRIDFRWVDTSNRMRLEIDIQTNSTIQLTIKQVVGGVVTTLAGPATAFATHSTTIPLKVRIYAIGKTVRVKIWRLVDDEPLVWDVYTSSVDDNLAINGYGGLGLTAFFQSTNTNTLPVVVRWDNFIVEEPHFVELDDFGGTSNEGLIAIGSNASINGESGMNILVRRSSTVSGSDNGDGFPDSGNLSMLVGTVDGGVVNPSLTFNSWQFFDKNGDQLVSDSLNARRGFDHPRLTTTWYDPAAYKTTTSGSFVNVASAEWYFYHAHLRVRLLVNNDAGNVSELRLIETPALTNTFSSFTTTSGYFGYVDLLIPRSKQSAGDSSNGNAITFSVDQRRVSGAGTVRCLVVSMTGIDLSWFNPY